MKLLVIITMMAMSIAASANSESVAFTMKLKTESSFRFLDQTTADEVQSATTGDFIVSVNSSSGKYRSSISVNESEPGTTRITELSSKSMRIMDKDGDVNLVVPIKSKGNKIIVKSRDFQRISQRKIDEAVRQLIEKSQNSSPGEKFSVELKVADLVCLRKAEAMTCTGGLEIVVKYTVE